MYLNDEIRPILTLFLALDSRIEDIFAKMNESMIAQIRLAWWRDTINSDIKPKGEPLVEMMETVQNQYPNLDIAEALIALINGWEYRIINEENLNEYELIDYANGRGAFFALIAAACDKTELTQGYQALGRIWALSFLFDNIGKTGEQARSLAAKQYETIDFHQLSRAIRSLSLLAFPAINAIRSNHKKQDGIFFGLSYIWHAITAR